VIAVLSMYGYSEAEVRAHSLDWIRDTWTTIDAHRGEVFRIEMAGWTNAICAGTVGANSEEGHNAMREMVSALLEPLETDELVRGGELPYDRDPNAKPDNAALEAWARGGAAFAGAVDPLGLPDHNVGISYHRMSKEDYLRGHRPN
jgi:hypothetical protein